MNVSIQRQSVDEKVTSLITTRFFLKTWKPIQREAQNLTLCRKSELLSLPPQTDGTVSPLLCLPPPVSMPSCPGGTACHLFTEVLPLSQLSMMSHITKQTHSGPLLPRAPGWGSLFPCLLLQGPLWPRTSAPFGKT